MDYSVAPTTVGAMTVCSETQAAVLLSQATHQATMAARSIFMSGGTETTALSTAKAAAMSVLHPKVKSGKPHLSRRRAKQHAEIVASIALMNAVTSIQRADIDAVSHYELLRTPTMQRTEMETMSQFARSPPTNVEVACDHFLPPTSGPPPNVEFQNDAQDVDSEIEHPEEDRKATASARGFASLGSAVLSYMGSFRDMGSKGSDGNGPPEPNTSKDISPTKVSKVNCKDKSVERGNTSFNKDQSSDKYDPEASDFREPETPCNENEQVRPSTSLQKCLSGGKKDTHKMKVRTPRKETRPNIPTDDLAAHIPYTDPIYSTRFEPPTKINTGSVEPETTVLEPEPEPEPEVAALIQPSNDSAETNTGDSFSTYDLSVDDENGDQESLGTDCDNGTQATESFDSEPFATPANGFMTKNVDPFLASLTSVFSCGTSQQPVAEPMAIADIQDDIAKGPAPFAKSKPWGALFNRNGESLSTVDTEEIVQALKEESAEDYPQPLPKQNIKPQSMEDIVLQNLSGTPKTTRVTVFSEGEGNGDQASKSRADREEGRNPANTLEFRDGPVTEGVVSKGQNEEEEVPELEMVTDAIAEFRFTSDPELTPSSATTKHRAFRPGKWIRRLHKKSATKAAKA